MGFGNPLLRFGCWANGEHVWTKPYVGFDGYRWRECRWCMHSQRGEYVGTNAKRKAESR